MVPEARLELARLERRGILNPLCLPIPPLGQIGAGNEARTRDPDLGKVVLYQLSYFRKRNKNHLLCEEEETRTPTSQLTLPPQSSASTNSATSPSLR